MVRLSASKYKLLHNRIKRRMPDLADQILPVAHARKTIWVIAILPL